MKHRLLRPGTLVGVLSLALVAGTVTALVQPRAPRTDSLSTIDIAPSPEVVTDVPEATGTPRPASTVAPTAAPSPVAGPAVTAVPASSSSAPREAPPLSRTDGTPAPSSPAPAVQTGNWTHTRNGVTLRLTMRPARPRAGQLVTFTVDMEGTAAGDCCVTQMLYGDNLAASKEEARYCAATRDKPSAGRARYDLHHGYRRAGTYTPWVHVMASCDSGPVYFTFKPTFRVEAGPLLSNGPVFPWADIHDSVGDTPEDDARGQWFLGLVQEHDGYPSAWTWNWGDGSPEEHGRNPDACRWPEDGGWIERDGTARAVHRFPATGTYTVTLTATSAGCDGRDAQVVTKAIRWTVHPGSPGAPPE